MWHIPVLAVSAVMTAGVSSPSPISIICDTDMDTDVDDVGALAVLHALADLNEVRLLAVMPLGASILTGGPLGAKGAPENPCRRAYDTYVREAHKCRSSWDLCAVLYAARGTGPWFKEKTGNRIRLAPEPGKSFWREDASSPQVLIEQAASDEAIRKALDDLLARPPAQQ